MSSGPAEHSWVLMGRKHSMRGAGAGCTPCSSMSEILLLARYGPGQSLFREGDKQIL